MGRITTHILDTSIGLPAANVRVQLARVRDEQRELLFDQSTSADGRFAAPLLQGQDMIRGCYELRVFAGEYFRQRGVALTEPPFLDQIVIALGIAASEQHYHVPLLLTPWSYAVYRGG